MPIDETEWKCEECGALNLMIYDDYESAFCIRKFFTINNIFRMSKEK